MSRCVCTICTRSDGENQKLRKYRSPQHCLWLRRCFSNPFWWIGSGAWGDDDGSPAVMDGRACFDCVFGMVDPFTVLVTLRSFFGGFSASHFRPDPLRSVYLLSAHPCWHDGLLSSSGGLSHLGCASVTSRWMMMMMMMSFSVFILQIQLLVQFLMI